MSDHLSLAVSDAASFSLSLIDDFELWYGDELVQMSPSSQRLVGFVALHDRPVRRTKVSGTLWLDSPEDRAGASLRSALWRIPAPGGVNILAASGTHLWLNACVQVDLRNAIFRAQQLLDGAQLDPAVIDVPRELCYFSGDLLHGWYDDWLVMERERFHCLRLQVLDRLGDQLCACGRFGDALQVGLAAVQAEPLRETAHRLVMRAHMEQGNVAEAIRQYQFYERTLACELGVVPSKAMRTLVGSCLDHTQLTTPELPAARRNSRPAAAGAHPFNEQLASIG
jgi:DNA-binding SARP family transcriptional activator